MEPSVDPLPLSVDPLPLSVSVEPVLGVALTAPPPPPPPPPQAARIKDKVIAENIPVSLLSIENIGGSFFSLKTLASKLFCSGVILIFVAPLIL